MGLRTLSWGTQERLGGRAVGGVWECLSEHQMVFDF